MLQFFYRAWRESQPAAQADRPTDDRFARYLALLSGAAEGSASRTAFLEGTEREALDGSAFPIRARLHYAGVFAGRRSASGIQDALSHLLRTPVRLAEFQPRWRQIEPDDHSRLGRRFNTLGGDTVLGGSIRTVTDAFRVTVRARSLREYEDFLPGGRRFRMAAEALDALSPSHLEWDMALELAADQAKPVKLDSGSRLGWTSWLAPRGGDGVRGDAHLGRSAQRLAREDGGRTTA